MAAMIASSDLQQEILAIDMLTAIKSSLNHSRKHVIRLLRLYENQAYSYFNAGRHAFTA